MTPEEKKAWACEQLVQKNTQLGRLPKKEDFDEATRSRIKAFLGPWPRALEAAGLKQAKPETVKSKKRNAGKLKAQRITALKKPEKSVCKKEKTNNE